MHLEIQVALHFLISFLYNKLPRRRVNNFGEELDKALKIKFEGHWYPEQPFKGSAYRCLKTTPPLDPVFEQAARESGMDLCDIQQNLPQELSIWIDPGEVSYRMSEKGPVKILYSEGDRIEDMDSERSTTRTSTFNPEAQSFKPLDLMASSFGSLSVNHSPGNLNGINGNITGNLNNGNNGNLTSPFSYVNGSSKTSPLSMPLSPGQFGSPTIANGFNKQNCTSTPSMPAATYGPKNSNITMTTAAFAQTKFGSTKLKTAGKRSQRMSPTDFGNYIKSRQGEKESRQQAQLSMSHFHSQIPGFTSNGTISPQNSRSISPDSPPLEVMNGFSLFMSTPGNTCNPQTPSPPNGYTYSPFGSAFDSISSSLDELLG